MVSLISHGRFHMISSTRTLQNFSFPESLLKTVVIVFRKSVALLKIRCKIARNAWLLSFTGYFWDIFRKKSILQTCEMLESTLVSTETFASITKNLVEKRIK